jgi:hypothetical protein
MLNHSVGSGQHTFEARGQDCYETPPCAVEALLKVEKLPKNIWEPACGSGNIAEVLRAAGHEVHASDLHDYGCGCPDVDFLEADIDGGTLPGAIVTNAPYKLAQAFVEKALELPLVIMLLRLAFLESERRSNILDNAGLARIHVFKNRLPMMHRKGWTGPKASSAISFAWFVWDTSYHGRTTIDRISWVRAEPMYSGLQLDLPF